MATVSAGTWIVGAIAAYGVYESVEASKDATKAAEAASQQAAATAEAQVQATNDLRDVELQQQAEQKKIADIEAQRERRRLIREQRITRSQLNVASGGDTSGSKVGGVTGSIGTGFASAQGFAGQQIQAGESIFQLGQQATGLSADIANIGYEGSKAMAAIDVKRQSASSRGQRGSAYTSAAMTGYNIWKG